LTNWSLERRRLRRSGLEGEMMRDQVTDRVRELEEVGA
jgi:hypothetical protein